MIDAIEKELLLNVGTMLNGRYEIIEHIAFGGFGATYKVVDRKDNSIRVIKEFFPRDISTRTPDGRIIPISSEKVNAFEHVKKRFVEEAETLYKLNGLPQQGVNRIVKLTDYFSANETKYYVMDFIDGCSLHDEFKKYNHGIPYQKVIAYLGEICDGMYELHSQYKLFHRDISPDNIMIRKDDHVQLIDFGNARALSAEKGYTVVLKVAYAPPEQYSTKGIQGTFTDVYSLAATAYHMISGQKIPDVSDRSSGVEIIPLNTIKPEVPQRIVDALNHALEFEPYKRPQTMLQFKQELGIDEYANAGIVISGVRPYIKNIRGDLSFTRLNIPVNTDITIGRSKKANIYVGSNGYLGRIHCALRYDSNEDVFLIRDYSKNGTYVEGWNIPYNTNVKVREGAHIILANRVIEFELGVNRGYM